MSDPPAIEDVEEIITPIPFPWQLPVIKKPPSEFKILTTVPRSNSFIPPPSIIKH